MICRVALGGGGDFYPHEPQAEIAQHGRGDPADPQGQPRVGDQARLVEPFGGAGGCKERRLVHGPRGNKKERVPAGAHSQPILRSN